MTRKTTLSEIRKIRESRGLTRRRVAAAVGLSENYIYKIENGLKTPTLSTLHKIAGVLGVKPSVLLDLPLHDLKTDISEMIQRLEHETRQISKDVIE